MAGDTNNDRYRQEQEDFVSHHGGTTARETLVVILPHISSVLLAITAMGVLGKHLNRNLRFVLECLLTIVPSVLCCTVLSERVIAVCLTMILLSIVNILLMGIKLDTISSSELTPVKGRRPFVTCFRSLTNILSVICILAVDFKVFPRKFAKTEVYGYSLMDTGVGLFMVANALVAPEARDFGVRPKLGLTQTLLKNFTSCAKGCTPLLILGLARYVSVEFLNYQKHVSEYGVHWNFFLTLAAVKVFTSTVTSAINSKFSLLSGIWILAMHEYILSTKGLKDWVLSDSPRNDFFSANREGLVSVPGYVGMYLVGVAVGRLIHSTYASLNLAPKLRSRQNILGITIFGYNVEMEYNESMVLCIKLSLIAAQACAATLVCDHYFGVSRRLANAGFCAWTITLSTVFLTLLLLIEIVTDILVYATLKDEAERGPSERLPGRKRSGRNRSSETEEDLQSGGAIETCMKRIPEVFEAVNYNGLAFFLVGNVLTGLVNMSMRTLYVTDSRAVLILTAYMLSNVSLFWILHRLRIQIKL